ncbi:hypothetical protein AHF37_09061 [Paragonimus kellicotti]|nr:hypothetical protein AHF37_09061 [Paragonimus kellicotti]
MNLELLEAFHQSYPEAADGHLERIKKDDGKDGGCATYTITLQFNRIGSLLAIGCNDGRVELWDYVTRRISKVLIAHTHPVCCLSWSRNSRQLLTASTDNTVSIWNVVTSDCERTFRFPCPVLKAQFNPRKADQFLDLQRSFSRTMRMIPASLLRTTDVGGISTLAIPKEECFLLNCADRIIRVFSCEEVLQADGAELEPNKKLKDLVTLSHWRKCCFSGDGEYICAGSMKQHSIYIWERSSGTLVKILHGQKGETLLDVVWHPLRPIIVSISNSVTKEQVSIWAQTQVQNWSAFAPDFKELDENVEYEERES